MQDRQEARKSHENDGLRFVEVFVDRSRVECVRETDGMKNGKICTFHDQLY